MKKRITLIIALLLTLCLLPINRTYASSVNYNVNKSNSYIEYLDDGSYFITEFDQSNGNEISVLSTNKSGTKTITYYSSSNEALCALKLTATFSYDGSIVSCVGAKYTTYSYDSAWSVEDVTTSHSNTSTTKASATANGTAVKRFLGIKIQSAALSTTIYCDKNGNLS